MAAVAQQLVNSLTPDQKKQALFAFDNPERTNWEFVPFQDKQMQPLRKGLRLVDMTAEQKKLAMSLVEAGTSASGNKQATTIMSLEALLKVQEAKKPANTRDPEWYFFTVFGTPGKTGNWGWRVEGHHLSINYTLNNNEVVSATPTFFGANPSTLKDGPKKGERILPEVEDYARELFKSLDDKQRAEAHAAQELRRAEIQDGQTGRRSRGGRASDEADRQTARPADEAGPGLRRPSAGGSG